MKNCDELSRIVLETPMKSGILRANESARTAKSDKWLQLLWVARQGLTASERARVSETSFKPASEYTLIGKARAVRHFFRSKAGEN